MSVLPVGLVFLEKSSVLQMKRIFLQLAVVVVDARLLVQEVVEMHALIHVLMDVMVRVVPDAVTGVADLVVDPVVAAVVQLVRMVVARLVLRDALMAVPVVAVASVVLDAKD